MCEKNTVILTNGFVMYLTRADNIALSYRLYRPNAKSIVDYYAASWMYDDKCEPDIIAKTILFFLKMKTDVLCVDKGDTRKKRLYHLKKKKK